MEGMDRMEMLTEWSSSLRSRKTTKRMGMYKKKR